MAPKPTKAEREKRKREEQERQAALEEERLQQEKEEEERRQEELRQEEEERQRKLEEEQKRFEEESKVLSDLLRDQQDTLRQVLELANEKEQWRHFVECDRSVNVTSLVELSSFVREWQDGQMDSETCLEETLELHHDSSVIITRLDRLLAAEESVESSKVALFSEVRNEILELMAQKLDEATQTLLVTPRHHISEESSNLEKTAADQDLIFHLWANMARNPRLKSIDFVQEFPFSMGIPKELVLANIGLRLIHSKSDTLSPFCKNFQMPRRKVQPDNEDTSKGPAADAAPEDVVAGSTAAVEATEGHPAEASPSRQNLQSPETAPAKPAEETADPKEDDPSKAADEEAVANGEEGGEDEEGEKEEEETADAVEEEDEFEESDDVYDENVVDLRNFRPVGGVVRLDLVQLPPQPRTYGVWTCQEMISPSLRYTTYPLPEEKTKVAEEDPPETPLPNTDGNKTPASGSKPTASSAGPEKVDISFTLPGDVTFTEKPQIARWDADAKHWRTDGFENFNYDADKQEVSFKTAHLAPYALMQDVYVNLPLVTWEMRPGEGERVLLSIETRLCPLEIEIREDMCCVAEKVRPDTEAGEEGDEDAKVDPVERLRGKWMALDDFQQALIARGVNIFPFDDGSRYVSTTRKDSSLEKFVYQQLGLLASGFAFSCSQWNSKAGKQHVVLKVCEPPGKDDLILDEHWQLCLVSEERTFRLGIQEGDQEYSADMAEATEAHPDLFNCLRLWSDKAAGAVRSASPMTVDTTTKLIASARLVTYS